MSRGYYTVKNQQEYEELIKTPRKEFKYDKIRILVAKRNKKMRELLEDRCYFNGDKKIEGKEYLEFHYFLRKYTYYFGLESKEENEMAGKILEKRGNWRPYNPRKDKNKVDFIYLYLDSKYDKKLLSLKSLLKNVTIKKGTNITNKHLLYQELEKIPSARKYLVDNYYVNLKNMDMNKIKKMFQKYGILIFKPVHGWRGIGIKIFDSFDSFDKYIFSKEFKESLLPVENVPGRNIKDKKYNDWVLQQYITNPLLVNSKRFHVRGYYLVHQEKKYLLKEGEFYNSLKNFELKNFDDSNIHGFEYNPTLTGDKNHNKVKIFPKILKLNKKTRDNIQEQMINLFHLIGGIDKIFNCYSETKDCYRVFGFDVMITDNYQVKIIEINENPAVLPLKINFGRKLFENEIKLIVDPIFPPKNKVDEKSDFIQVY